MPLDKVVPKVNYRCKNGHEYAVDLFDDEISPALLTRCACGETGVKINAVSIIIDEPVDAFSSNDKPRVKIPFTNTVFKLNSIDSMIIAIHCIGVGESVTFKRTGKNSWEATQFETDNKKEKKL